MNKPLYIIFKKNTDIRGSLTAIESDIELPFDIKRIFYISKLDNIERGYHAHRKCEQIIIPISGSFRLILDNGIEEQDFLLDKSHIGIYIPLFHWLKMKDFSKDCIILVICSYKYDEAEYIRDYSVFLHENNKLRNSIININNFSLKTQTNTIKREVIHKIENIIDKNEFTMGHDVLEFEENFSKYNNTLHCIAVSNGCSALKIAIKSLNLTSMKVLTQANTYVAVPLTCEELNIPYELIDIDDNLLLDLNKLETYLIKNKDSVYTFIVLVVHLYGNCVNMDKLMELKNIYNFKLIEDSAQAHGSTYKKQKLGTFGELGCFSFYPSKNLGSFGEAGAIVTNNDIYDKYCRLYRNYGSIEKYKWEIIGANERMHNIQGGILNIKLKYLDEWNFNRKKLANIYYETIKENNKLKILKPIDGCDSNIHLFILIVDERDKFKQYLEENNIQCAIHYPKPFYQTEAYKHVIVNNCDNMDYFKDKLLTLPIYPELSEENVKFVCEKINSYTDKFII
jgi:dTDP-4-amino-4,6-dideoxygalactose transaminase